MSRLFFMATVLSALRLVNAADGVRWSKPDTDDTPQGHVHFHGPFGRENVDVSCNLGKHDFIRISFDLLIIHTWDGSWTLGTDGLPAELGEAFDEALKLDSDKRMEAFAKLVTGMDTTTTWVQINVSSVPIDAEKVTRLVKNLSLDDRDREARDAAMQELLQLGPQVEV